MEKIRRNESDHLSARSAANDTYSDSSIKLVPPAHQLRASQLKPTEASANETDTEPIQCQWKEKKREAGTYEWEGAFPPDMSTFPELGRVGPATKKAFTKHKLPGAEKMLGLPEEGEAVDTTGADIKSIAETAVAFTKMTTPLGSFNKGYGMTGPVPEDKREEQATMPDRRRIVNATKSLMPIPDGVDMSGETTMEEALSTGKVDMSEMIKYGQVVMGGKAGNCFELSAAALVYISGQLKDTDVDYGLVSLAAPGDHAFVVINQSADESGKYPKSFAAWDEGAYVVDPWVGVACPARRFPTRWKAVLDQWNTDGLSIGASRPTNDMWYNAIEVNDKLRYSSR